jgi:uncharacterized protein (DUF433 family)
MEKEKWIEVNPKVMMGKPVVKGTRITVELILERLALGQTINDLLVAYPHLTEEKIQAALSYAAQTLKGDTIIASAS